MKTIGLISDTHGLLRDSAEKALQDAELIVHAGDVGSVEVLRALKKIAPVIAVRGNMDGGRWAADLPLTDVVDVDGILFYVLHDISRLDIDPAAANISGVIYGHSHKPALQNKDGVIYLNPGSAGPKRFTLPISIAKIFLDGSGNETEIRTEFIKL